MIGGLGLLGLESGGGAGEAQRCTREEQDAVRGGGSTKHA